MEVFTAFVPNEVPILHPSVPRIQNDRNMAASSSDTSPYATKELSGRLSELLNRTRQACSSTIVSSNRPADRATLYLHFNPQSELVREIENGFNKKSHHCYLAIFFRGEFTVGEMYDTVILPLEKFGTDQARTANTTLGQTLDWGGQEYFVITGKFDFIIDGGKLASVVVAFDRDKNQGQGSENARSENSNNTTT